MSWKKDLRHLLRRTGYDVSRYRPRDDFYVRLATACQRAQVDCLIDAGANIGQFGEAIRLAGYDGEIVSFEPVSSAHARLQKTAARHAGWQVFKRAALGDADGEITINISHNSQVSSLLPLRDDAEAAATGARYVGSEKAPVFRLDSVIDQVAPHAGRIALKLDVQGFEAQVLAGAAATLPRIMLITTEMSLAPMYDGETLFMDLYLRLINAGFRCIGLSPAYIHQQSFEVMHVDGVFIRS